MLGANRVAEEDWRHYVEYVRGGGVLVLGLYQVLAPARDRTYFKEDLSELLGVRLGRDVPLSNHATLADRQTFISQHYNQVQLAGAEAVERLPNGDPLLTRFKLGDGWAYFLTTDRLTTAPGAAERLIRGLFEPHVAVALNPASDRMEIAVSAKGDVRIVTLMDHGRDALPTDAGEDTGPYAGTVTLELERLGLPEGEYEVFAAQTDEKITRLELQPLACARKGRALDVQVQGMGPYLELVIGPKGKAEHAFFRE
jgi:hypothetical protein